MADTLVTTHSIWRWLVLVGLVAALVYGFSRSSDAAPLEKSTAQPFMFSLIMLDIQVLIGLFLWIAASGWDLDVFRAWIHPVGMLIALGVGHAVVGRAIKFGASSAYRTAAVGILVTLVIVAASIPRDAWF
ncbi:MAG: hypothetical protein OEM81_12870 [Acidimicrobiia bacterium]|nr:hypothetical protein [Acidimicrobiia bacterium]MDH3398704.1 hypothetical protein [Acidimicrobiia bacterium]MDH5615209.1 hypothetical protein [Acidimicrobiia bacterium]